MKLKKLLYTGSILFLITALNPKLDWAVSKSPPKQKDVSECEGKQESFGGSVELLGSSLVPIACSPKSVRELFKDIPAFSRTDEETGPSRDVALPGELGKLRLTLNIPEDVRIAEAAGKIFRNRPIKELPSGDYNYIVMESGDVIFASVDDSWEVGVRHKCLAQNEKVKVAGELKIDRFHNLTYNIQSGSYTFKAIADSIGMDKTTYLSTKQLIELRQSRPELVTPYIDGMRTYLETNSPGAKIAYQDDTFNRPLPTREAANQLCSNKVGSPKTFGARNIPICCDALKRVDVYCR